MYAQAYNALNGLLPYRPGTGMIITGQSSLVVQHVTTAAVCVVSVQKHDQTGHAVQTDNSEQVAGTGSDRSGKNLLPYVTFYAHLSLFVKQPRPLNVVSRRGTSRDRFFQISWSGPSSPSVLHTPIRVNRSATSNHVLEHAPYRRLQHVIEHSALPRLTCRHCFLYLAARWSVHICCVHVATCAHLQLTQPTIDIHTI